MKRRGQVNAAKPGRGARRYVFGLHTVGEYLSRAPEGILEVWLAMPLNRGREAIASRAAELGLGIHRAAQADLDRLSEGAPHQGVVAVLREFGYLELEDLAHERPRMLVAADGIEDPRNLGALIRAVAAAGAGGLVVPRDRAAQITAVTEKASAGVTAFFPVARVTNLARALEALKRDFGYWAVALVQDGATSLYAADLPEPMVLVFGGESGVRPLVRQKCDIEVAIPMAAGVESLNVAVAAAVACFEVRRRLG